MTTDQNIMGSATVSQSKAVAWIKSRTTNPKLTCSLENLVQYYWEEGAKEGVRPDLILCLSLKETGWFQYGGIVQPSQNNFGGLGAFNDNAPGQAASFPDCRTGVRAVIQHAKGYATKSALSQPCVDPRYQALIDAGYLGSAPKIHGLSGKWAWPGYDKNKYASLTAAYNAGATYGQDITRLFDALVACSGAGGATMKIAFCAGHGMYTSGKRTPDDEREWSFNNRNAIAFENEMKQYRGVQLLRTDDRTGKTDVSLSERTNKANAWGAQLYISFHHNAHKGEWGSHTGSEVYYWDGTNQWIPQSKKLAEQALKGVVNAYRLRNRGVKRFDFHICREAKCPAILIEGGFMDSTIDIKIMRQNVYLDRLGKYVAEEVGKLYGLQKGENEMKPRFGVFALNAADFESVDEILSKVKGAAKFDWYKTPTEMFEHIVHVGGNPVRPQYTHLSGKDRADTLAKVRAWIAKNQ